MLVVVPGFGRDPEPSALRIIHDAALSFPVPPGFKLSILTNMERPTNSERLWSRTIVVFPMSASYAALVPSNRLVLLRRCWERYVIMDNADAVTPKSTRT